MDRFPPDMLRLGGLPPGRTAFFPTAAEWPQCFPRASGAAEPVKAGPLKACGIKIKQKNDHVPVCWRDFPRAQG